MVKGKKLLFISEYPFRSRDFKRFHIQKYKENGLDVQVLEISGIFKNKKNENNENVQFISSYSKFKKYLKEFSPDIIFSLISTTSRERPIIRILVLNFINKNYNCIENCGPNGPFEPEYKKFKTKLKKVFYKKMLRSFKFSYVCGSEALKKATGKPIYGHSWDYDNYISMRENHETEDILLFLDEDYVYHPDYEVLNMNAPVTEESYYSEVNKILKSISETHNLSVEIQLHPKASLEIGKKMYDFDISSRSTIEAISRSKLVVTHDSTALSYAVLLEKPVILIKTEEIKNSVYDEQINRFSHELGCPIVDIENLKNLTKELKYDENKYEKYKKKYLCSHANKSSLSYELITNVIKF